MVTLNSNANSNLIGHDYLYSPYNFITRKNDIYDINLKNIHDE